MKKTRNTLRSMMTMVVMVMAFAVTGITAKAAEVPTNLVQESGFETYVNVEWKEVSGASWYGVQAAKDKDFKDIVWEHKVTYFSNDFIKELDPGSVYYVRVGWGNSPASCFANYSEVLEVVTAPNPTANLKYVGADDKTAKLAWEASNGATGYEVTYKEAKYDTVAPSYALPIDDGAINSASVRPYKESSVGFRALGPAEGIRELSKLTTKFKTNEFKATKDKYLKNVYFFQVAGSGYGWEVEGQTVAGKKYKFSAKYASETLGLTTKMGNAIRLSNKTKLSKMYKYRVRAYIITTDKEKVYGDWSDYRYLCEANSVKGTSKNKQINVKWSKLTGVSKVKVQISTKKDKGFKTCTTLSGKKTSYTIKKYGKAKLKKGKIYYVKLSYQYKKGKKTYTSDATNTIKVKVK